MTVKELKERLEILIEEGKEDYTVFVDDSEEFKDVYIFYVKDEDKEVYL